MEGAESGDRIGVCGDREAGEGGGVAAGPRLPLTWLEWRQLIGLSGERGCD